MIVFFFMLFGFYPWLCIWSWRSIRKAMKTQQPDWRIQPVPAYDHLPGRKAKSAEYGFFCVFGVILFTFAGLFLARPYWSLAAMLFSIAGASICLGWYAVMRRASRRTWVRVKSRCLDSEYRCLRVNTVANPGGSGGGYTWGFRILCEYEWKGAIYRVTPQTWRTFFFEAGVRHYLRRVINSDGECFLHVNPKNLLEVEVSTGSILDKLLYSCRQRNVAAKQGGGHRPSLQPRVESPD